MDLERDRPIDQCFSAKKRRIRERCFDRFFSLSIRSCPGYSPSKSFFISSAGERTRFSPSVVLFRSKFSVLFDRTDSRSFFPLISPPIRSTSFLVFSRFVFELFPLSPRYPRNLIFLLFFFCSSSFTPPPLNFISSPIPTEIKRTLNLAELNFPTMRGCDFFFDRVIPNELLIKKLGFRRVRFRCSLRNVLCLNSGQ